MQAVKELTPLQGESPYSNKIRKFLSLALILSVVQFGNLEFATQAQAAASTGAISSYVVSSTGGGNLKQSNCNTGAVLTKVYSSNEAPLKIEHYKAKSCRINAIKKTSAVM